MWFTRGSKRGRRVQPAVLLVCGLLLSAAPALQALGRGEVAAGTSAAGSSQTGSSQSGSSGSGAAGADAVAAEVESRRAPSDALVIYSYSSLPGALRRAIAEHFESRYGVAVDLQRLGDTGELYTQLFLERNAPRADAVIGLDSTFLARLRRDRLAEPYRPSDLQLARPELLVDPEYLVVPFDYGMITINYDRQLLPNPPRSWQELTDSRFRNALVVMHPGTSSPGRNFLLATIAQFGEDGYLDFWRALRPNILTVTGGWSDAYGLYTQGEAPMVISYDTSPAYHRHFEQSDRYDNALFDGAGYLQVEVAFITRGATNRLNAERLIDYLVSREFQELIPLSQIMYPIHPDVTLPAAFEAITRAQRAVRLPDELVQTRFETWVADWEEVMR